MRLLLIRHAIAQNREVFRRESGLEDGLRPLRQKGRGRMKKAARGLLPYAGEVQQFATSPYVRAVSTARIVVKRAGFPKPVEVEALLPDRHPREFLDWFNQRQKDRAELSADLSAHLIIAAVGHEPHLSGLIAWSLTGREAPFGELKKGGACLLRFDSEVSGGRGVMEWLLTAGQLRRFRR